MNSTPVRNSESDDLMSEPFSPSKQREISRRIDELMVPKSVSPQGFSRHIRENLKLNEEEAFFERISTFASLNWSVKSPRFSAPKCASYGWKVSDRDLLQCCTCKEFLSAHLPPVWNQSYHEAVERLEKSLKESHAKYCPWPFYPSPENFLTNKLLDFDGAVKEFGERLCAVHAICKFLPRIPAEIPPLLNLDECGVLRLSRLVGIEDGTKIECIIIALMGWKLMEDDVASKRICCYYCLRKTELSLYLPPESTINNGDCVTNDKKSNDLTMPEIDDKQTLQNKPDDSSNECEEPQVKKFRKWELRPFHPLEEHQKWCPWVSGSENDDNPLLLPGWRRLLGILHIRIDSSETAVDNKVLTVLRRRILAAKKTVKGWLTDTKGQQSSTPN